MWRLFKYLKKICYEEFFSDILNLGEVRNFLDDPASRWAILPPSDLLTLIDFLIQLSRIKFQWILPDLICGSQNEKSIKVNKSLGGSIAHLEAGSSQNFRTSHKQRISEKNSSQQTFSRYLKNRQTAGFLKQKLKKRYCQDQSDRTV